MPEWIGRTVGGRYELLELVARSETLLELRGRDLDGTVFRVSLLLDADDVEAFESARERVVELDLDGFIQVAAVGFDEETSAGFVVHRSSRSATLEHRMTESGPLGPHVVAGLGIELASAIASLHAQGIHHGCLEPGCIHLEERGPIIAGLGLLLPRTPSARACAAPEVRAGEQPSAASDTFALASCLVAAVTGSLDGLADPADGLSRSAMEGLMPVLDRARSEVPSERYADARELATALRAFVEPAGDVGLQTTLGEAEDSAPSAEPGALAATAVADPLDEQAASSSMNQLIGQRIDERYELVELLGEGGMGAVFRALGPESDDVAIKVMRPEAASDQTLRRFMREARVSMGIESENVVRVLDTGWDAKRRSPFIVMELLRGRDLGVTLDDTGALDPSVAARIFVAACRGVAAAHARGLIHRDIKPANIFLHCDERDRITPKICDFGIAKHDGLLTETQTALTRTGGILGSPAYMSPEQAQDAKGVDARTDIWSLSISLYEALAGQPAWSGCKNVGELMAWLYSKDVPPLQSIASWIPAPLARTVHEGLVREPAGRIQTASELADRLEPFARPTVDSSDITAVSDKVRSATAERLDAWRPSTKGWLVATATLLGAGILYAVLTDEDEQTSHPSSSTEELGAPALEPARCQSRVDCPLATDSTWCSSAGLCVELASPECRVLGNDAALDARSTLWIGTMFPVTDPDYGLFGTSSERAVELARRDFMATTGGLPQPDGASRPIGVVACDDTENAAESARHLVNLGAAAVIGFRSSKEVSELSTNVFLPNQTMVIPSLNQSDLITSIPHPEGSPRLVWRTAARAAQSGAAVGTLARHLPVELGIEEPRIALVRVHHATGLTLSKEIRQRLLGREELGEDQAERWLELAFSDDDDTNMVALATRLSSFEPDIVILASFAPDQTKRLLERSDLASSRTVVISSGSIEGPLHEWVADNSQVAGRVFGLSPPARTPQNLEFTQSYNATFGESLAPELSPAAPYDSFYLAVYAAFAAESAGAETLSGKTLSEAVPRLLPPGTHVAVGPTDILKAFGALKKGENIDLQGAFSLLDFDTTLGETEADFAITCAVLTRDGDVESRESGLVYVAADEKLVGGIDCDVADR